MGKNVINTEKAPAAIGAYSQGISMETEGKNLIFTSGQLGLNPVSGEPAEGVEAQTKQSMENVAAILEAAGSGVGNILKTTVYTTQMDKFADINEVYRSFFEGSEPPARSVVGVSALPKGALVEIEAIAYK